MEKKEVKKELAWVWILIQMQEAIMYPISQALKMNC